MLLFVLLADRKEWERNLYEMTDIVGEEKS